MFVTQWSEHVDVGCTHALALSVLWCGPRVRSTLLGAQFLDNGFAAARDVVRLLWRPALESGAGKSKHPKSALQEWAAGNQRRPL